MTLERHKQAARQTFLYCGATEEEVEQVVEAIMASAAAFGQSPEYAVFSARMAAIRDYSSTEATREFLEGMR
jgi:hypothetical protein